ncbi:hypothetical protein [Culicoidibacter larvae]|uniref:Uncharacterized protein n=1 Tax=Culicoidibacter larvae TaxID=2579976 RepID=A0A5R8QBC6_9FIRM|nr:hypothetical protein [Culicoidibacter larvae]TLG73881.1 hypothetical protein FEZ08_07050 [Culicoidibacter larvae]
MQHKDEIIQQLIDSEKLYKKASGIKGSASTIAIYLLLLSLLAIMYSLTGWGNVSVFALAQISPMYFITLILPVILVPTAAILFFIGRREDRKLINHGQKILAVSRVLLDTIKVCQVKIGNATTTCFLAYDESEETSNFIKELFATIENDSQLNEQIRKELLINQLTTLQELLCEYSGRDQLHLYTSFSRKKANATIIDTHAQQPQDKYIPMQIPQYIASK